MPRRSQCLSLLLSLGMILPVAGCGGTGAITSITQISPPPAVAGPPSGTPSGASTVLPGPPSSCGGTSAPAATSKFLYVGSNGGYSDWYNETMADSPAELMAFSVSADGSLQPLTGFPCPGEVSDLDVNPQSRTLYLAGGSQVASYSVSDNGSVVQTSSVSAGVLYLSPGDFYALTIDPAHRNGYALMSFGAGHEASEKLTINADGTLTDAGSLGNAAVPIKNYFSPVGSLAYGPGCSKGAFLMGYHQAANGALNAFDPKAIMPPVAPEALAGCMASVAISPDGKYFASYLDGEFQPDRAWLGGFQINGDGTLTQLPGFPVTPSQLGSDIVWDPTGQYLVTAEHDGVHVYAFSLGAAPVHLVGPIGDAEMNHLMFDKSGTLLFATSISPHNVYVFVWNNGSLTPAPGSPHALSGQAGRMAIIQ